MIHNNISDSTQPSQTPPPPPPPPQQQQQQQPQPQPPIERIIPLPSVIIDFMAMTLCDLIPPRKVSARRRQFLPNLSSITMPELVYFIQKITFQAGINCRTALVGLIYLNRAKQLLPKGAVGGHDTCHRMFLASILLASKFLCTDSITIKVLSNIPSTWSHYYSFHHYQFLNFSSGPLTNRKLSGICGEGLFPLDEINQLERAFLKLIQYQCWVDDKEIHNFVLKHRVDFSL
ncbi:cyclin domain-containing protein [Helicostylum pulchrum]|nr:cyclin domain-containing protein [Helicostylum pulchrum]